MLERGEYGLGDWLPSSLNSRWGCLSVVYMAIQVLGAALGGAIGEAIGGSNASEDAANAQRAAADRQPENKHASSTSPSRTKNLGEPLAKHP